MARFAHRGHIAIFVLAVGVLALVGVSLTSAQFNSPDPVQGQVNFVEIDLDSSGNTFTSVASVNDTQSVVPSQTFTIDVVVDEVHPADGISLFEGNLHWTNPGSFHVVSVDPDSMIYASPPGNPYQVTDTVPDADGNFYFSYSDFSPNYESGEGVLIRITMQCDGPDSTSLDLMYDLGGYSQVMIADSSIEDLPVIFENAHPLILCGVTPTPTPICSPLPGDPDCDQIFNPNDNCPNTWNQGQADGDGDGDGDVCDNCPLWPNASQAYPLQGVQPTAGDADCDGFPGTTAVPGRAPETYIGTDPLVHCAATAAANDEGLPDTNPMDFNDDRIYNGQDTGQFGGAGGGFNKPVSAGPFNGRPGARYNFNGDLVINGQDTGKYGGASGYFNETCVTAGP